MMKTRCFVLAVVVSMFIALMSVDAFAAIGIFNWYARSSTGTAQVYYYLNLPGDSGSIRICPDQSGLPGEPVRTIPLSPSDLTPGAHSVNWDGKNDTGSQAPSGSYFAEIKVHAAPAPVPVNPDDPAQLNNNLIKFNGPSLGTTGVAVDINPTNNNQQEPDKSSYGLIYVVNSSYNRIEVYYPDGMLKATWPANVSNPWGVAVSSDGRVFTMRKATIGSVYNYLSDGSDKLGGNTCIDGLGGGAAWGNTCDGSAYFQTLHQGFIKEWKILSEPVSPNGYLTNFDSSNTISIPLSNPNMCYQTAKDTTNGYLYTAQYNNAGMCSLRRFAWNGSTYSMDESWIPDAGFDIDGVAISRQDPNMLFVGRYQLAGPNLERWYIEHPDAGISGPAVLDRYRVTTGMVHNVASDSRGNVIFDADGLNPTSKQRSVGMFVFPDNGSEDSRVAGPFMHEGSGQMLEKERIRDLASLTDGTQVTVRDKVVSACFEGILYVQESDRAAGVRVEVSAPVTRQPGDVVNVSGVVDRTTGETRLVNATITPVGSVDPPRPLGMVSASMAAGSSGLKCTGLLVRVTGQVTSVDMSGKLFYIDDGGGLDNGIGRKGVMVSFTGINPPYTGDRTVVTGALSCITRTLAVDTVINGVPMPAGAVVSEPFLLPRNQQGVQIINSQ